MTYKEYIVTSLSKFNLLESEIDLILIDNGLTAGDAVDPLVAKDAIYKSLTIWLPVHSSVSEGGVSVSWNMEAVKLFYASLCNELGLNNVIKDSQSAINDRTYKW
jgi:hypothetical protein